MRGAFVVRLSTGRQVTEEFEGSVEEVDTGKEIHFRSEPELIRFLRERIAQIRGISSKEKRNERTDDRC